MLDLLPGILLVLALGIGALVVGLRCSPRLPARSKLLIVLSCVVLICIFRLYVEERLWVARLIPFSGALTLVAWSPAFACAAVGFGWDLLGPSRRRRLLVSIPLIAIALFASNRMFLERRAPTQFDYRAGGWAQ